MSDTSGLGKSPDTGFTLIEILVVILIIGILAAYFGQNVFGQTDDAKVAVAEHDIAVDIPRMFYSYLNSHPHTDFIERKDIKKYGLKDTTPWGWVLSYNYRGPNRTPYPYLQIGYPCAGTPAKKKDVQNCDEIANHFTVGNYKDGANAQDIKPDYPLIRSLFAENGYLVVTYRTPY